MYLKRLEIQGFKSFPSRTAFEFGSGVTAVIGPNGSGKSNVADAIRWVLGEPNPRAMRLRRLDDALFAGGHKRAPAGFAEVSMWLDNSGGWLPLDFAEVVVSRRLHRSGDTEYLLNRQRVRLRDINELFLKARLGQNSYAIMGQGLVDQVLSLRPEERRSLIEEAAEIRRYRLKIEEAQDRLAATQENLEKVDLLVAEIAPRLLQLDRQARRAREHEELSRALAEALHAWYGHQWRTRDDALVAARAVYDQRNAAFAAAQAELDQLDQRLATVRARLSEERAAEQVAAEALRRLDDEARAAAHRLRLEEERLVFVQRRLEELQAELGALDVERHGLMQAGDPSEAAGGEAGLEQARRTLAAATAALHEHNSGQREAERRVVEAEAVLRRLRSALREAEDQLAQSERGLEAAERALPEAAQRRTLLLDRLAAAGRRFLAQRQELVRVEAEAARAEHQHEAARRGLDTVREDTAALEQGMAALRGEVAELARRYELLERMRDQHRGLDGAARALADGGERGGLSILGVLGELLRVPRGMEVAIEAALAEYLSAVVVPAQRDAVAALHALYEGASGRATLVPLAALRPSPALNLRNERGVVGVASRFVKCDPPYRELVDTLLGRFILVDNLETAQSVLRRGLGTVVTLDGIILRPNGTITGGRTAAEGGRFALDRELAEIPAQIERLLAEQERRDGELAEARRRVDAWRASVQEWGAEAERTRRLVSRAREALLAERAALAPVRSDLRHLRQTAAAAADRSAALRQEREQGRATHAALSEQLAAAEAAAVAARRAGEAAAAQREELSRAAAEARGLVTALEREQQAVAALRESRRATLARLEERITARAREADSRRREIGQVEADRARLRGAIDTAAASREQWQRDAAPVHDRLRSLAHELEELEPLHDARRRVLADLERACLNAESDVHRRAQEFERLLEELVAEGLEVPGGGQGRPVPPSPPVHVAEEGYAATPARREPGSDGQPAGVFSALAGAVAAADPAELQERIRSLRARIRALGPVNAQADIDYREGKERHDFLIEQVADLQAAEAGLREALEELRRLVRERFRTAFQQVGAEFQQFFKTFFGGGTARLVLTEPEDYGESGVDIIARPPGKRLQSLSLLSGGERSMTAVALLFALLQSNPAPFCVLDEVDAALDEANVGRFGDALKGLAERTQFIVITHNRLTIQAADTIYGVSMGGDGASTVLSLRLADVPQEDGA